MGCLESPTTSIINFKLMPVAQSRDQRDAAVRRGSVGAILAATERNTNATVGAPVLETVVTKDGFEG